MAPASDRLIRAPAGLSIRAFEVPVPAAQGVLDIYLAGREPSRSAMRSRRSEGL